MNNGIPMPFTVAHIKLVKNARVKYAHVKHMLSNYLISNCFYELNANDNKIVDIFKLLDTCTDTCECKPRTFNAGAIYLSDGMYHSFGPHHGMKAKTVAYKIKERTQGLRTIILSEVTPDQGLRYYSYAVTNNKLIFKHVKFSKDSEAEKDEREAEKEEEDNYEGESDDEEDNYEGESEGEEEEHVESPFFSSKRGDDPGDITNCLQHGDIIYHNVLGNAWYATYDAAANMLNPCYIMEYTRGGEVCPIQDFAVAHLKMSGQTYTDNSWTQCLVYKPLQLTFIPILDIVHRHFGRS
jgi:hypothetical protein